MRLASLRGGRWGVQKPYPSSVPCWRKEVERVKKRAPPCPCTLASPRMHTGQSKRKVMGVVVVVRRR